MPRWLILQTDHCYFTSEVATAVSEVVTERPGQYLEQHPKEARNIINKGRGHGEREAARKACEMVQRKGALELTSLPGEIADRQTLDPEKSEIFVVEGESGSNSAKQGRRRQFLSELRPSAAVSRGTSGRPQKPPCGSCPG